MITAKYTVLHFYGEGDLITYVESKLRVGRCMKVYTPQMFRNDCDCKCYIKSQSGETHELLEDLNLESGEVDYFCDLEDPLESYEGSKYFIEYIQAGIGFGWYEYNLDGKADFCLALPESLHPFSVKSAARVKPSSAADAAVMSDDVVDPERTQETTQKTPPDRMDQN